MKSKKKIAIAVGTRPELIRFAPLIHALQKSEKTELLLIHTGQHYSELMNEVFFRELMLPEPHVNLSVGGLAPNDQIGQIIIKTGEAIDEEKPDLVCVWGDTNSSLGVALSANKKGIKLCHLEAGCRSHDFRMAEEYNRILIDHLSDYLFPLSKNDQENLQNEKVHGKSFFFGDPLYDVFLENHKKAVGGETDIVKQAGKNFILMTLHRAENVDNPQIIKNILMTVNKIEDQKIVFPIHPRTEKMIETFGFSNLLKKKSIILTPPLGYHDMISALCACSLVITDSGGLQKEAFFAKKTCVTLRRSTEWLDTVKLKVNILLDPETDEISRLLLVCKEVVKTNQIFNDMSIKPYGDGQATKKILNAIIDELNHGVFSA